MTVKECYSQMGGDYNNVLSRFYDEAMIKRLLGRFIDHTSFRALEQAMTEGDTQAAFNAAHTLRGVCQSLSFTQLCGTLDSITEALRGGNITIYGDGGQSRSFQYIDDLIEGMVRSRHGQGKAGV